MYTLSYLFTYSGSTIRIERVSPEVIILRPPGKLAIEVRVSGDYEVLFWNKDNSSQAISIPGLMPNFYEIFVRDNATVEDEGIYTVTPQYKSETAGLYTLIPSGGVDFAVTLPGRLQKQHSITVDANVHSVPLCTIFSGCQHNCYQ